MDTETHLTAPVWEGDRAPLAKALVAAQSATEAVKKAATNTAFGGGSKYADLATVVEAVVPALNAAGVAVVQFPTFDGQVVAVTTTLLHEGGSSLTSTLHLRPTKMDPQGVGSAITYGRRYSLLAMTGAAPEDDDGNAASGPGRDNAPPPQTKRADPPKPTLGERAKALTQRIKTVADEASLEKVLRLGDALLTELDNAGPEYRAEIDAMVKRRRDELTRVPEAAE